MADYRLWTLCLYVIVRMIESKFNRTGINKWLGPSVRILDYAEQYYCNW